MKTELTECSEMSEHQFQVPRYHPKERIQHSEHGKILEPRKCIVVLGLWSRVIWFVINTMSSLLGGEDFGFWWMQQLREQKCRLSPP
jgi:hypothetical protein